MGLKIIVTIYPDRGHQKVILGHKPNIRAI